MQHMKLFYIPAPRSIAQLKREQTSWQISASANFKMQVFGERNMKYFWVFRIIREGNISFILMSTDSLFQIRACAIKVLCNLEVGDTWPSVKWKKHKHLINKHQTVGKEITFEFEKFSCVLMYMQKTHRRNTKYSCKLVVFIPIQIIFLLCSLPPNRLLPFREGKKRKLRSDLKLQILIIWLTAATVECFL